MTQKLTTSCVTGLRRLGTRRALVAVVAITCLIVIFAWATTLLAEYNCGQLVNCTFDDSLNGWYWSNPDYLALLLPGKGNPQPAAGNNNNPGYLFLAQWVPTGGTRVGWSWCADVRAEGPYYSGLSYSWMMSVAGVNVNEAGQSSYDYSTHIRKYFSTSVGRNGWERVCFNCSDPATCSANSRTGNWGVAYDYLRVYISVPDMQNANENSIIDNIQFQAIPAGGTPTTPTPFPTSTPTPTPTPPTSACFNLNPELNSPFDWTVVGSANFVNGEAFLSTDSYIFQNVYLPAGDYIVKAVAKSPSGSGRIALGWNGFAQMYELGASYSEIVYPISVTVSAGYNNLYAMAFYDIVVLDRVCIENQFSTTPTPTPIGSPAASVTPGAGTPGPGTPGYQTPTSIPGPGTPGYQTPTPTPTTEPTAVPHPVGDCIGPINGAFDSYLYGWNCYGYLGNMQPRLMVQNPGIDAHSLYWIQTTETNYPTGEGCFDIGNSYTFQIDEWGEYVFEMDYNLFAIAPGINAHWSTVTLIPDFPGHQPKNVWSGNLLYNYGTNQHITGTIWMNVNEQGPWRVGINFWPRRSSSDGPGTTMLMIDNVCVRKYSQPSPPTPGPSSTPGPGPTATLGPSPTPGPSLTPQPTDTPGPSPTPWQGPFAPEPPPPISTVIACDGPPPGFPPDSGICGEDFVWWTNPIAWVNQQWCKLLSLVPRMFVWLSWFLRWLFCPITDILAWLLCLFAIMAAMFLDVFSFLGWLWEFFRAMFSSFNTNRVIENNPFQKFLGGWLWEAIKEFFVAFRARQGLGWLYDYGIRAMVYWNTFWWVLGLIGGASGSSKAADSKDDGDG